MGQVPGAGVILLVLISAPGGIVVSFQFSVVRGEGSVFRGQLSVVRFVSGTRLAGSSGAGGPARRGPRRRFLVEMK
jgi:hypothetical protein